MAKRLTKEKFPTSQIAGVLAGTIAAGIVEKLVTKFLPTASGTVKALVPLGAGIFLAMQKNAVVKGAGFGMIGVGGSALVNAFMPAAVGEIDDLFISENYDDGMYGEDDYLGSPADQSILSAPADQSILSGMEEDGMNGEEEFINRYDEGTY
jgi:hypothetical protein